MKAYRHRFWPDPKLPAKQYPISILDFVVMLSVALMLVGVFSGYFAAIIVKYAMPWLALLHN